MPKDPTPMRVRDRGIALRACRLLNEGTAFTHVFD
jgi:hypothetical protein